MLSYLTERGISVTGIADPTSTDELLRNIMVTYTLVALICLPFVTCRLRDMGWPVVLSALVLLPLLPQSILMFHLLSGGEHAAYQLAAYLSAVNYAEILVLAFVVLLLLWPGRMLPNEASQ